LCAKKIKEFYIKSPRNFFPPLSEVLITFLVEDNSTLGARSKYLSLKRNIYTVYKGGASEYLAVVLSFIAALILFFFDCFFVASYQQLYSFAGCHYEKIH
jgi:hypothetical protein